MWKNKEVKREARHTLKKRYFTIIVTCFILVYFGVIAGLGDTISTLKSDDGSGIISGYYINEKIAESAPKEDGAIKQSAEKTVEETEPTAIEEYMHSLITGDKASQKSLTDSILASFQGTGGFIYAFLYRIAKLVTAHDWLAKLSIVVALLIFFIWYVFIKNILYVGFLRTMMEHRVYKKTKILRILGMFRMKGFLNIVWVMLARMALVDIATLAAIAPLGITAILFAKDCIGIGFVMAALPVTLAMLIWVMQIYFSLYAVPYIAATAPTLGVRNTLHLSRDMMRGNRMHMFGLNCSFILWIILSMCTLGLLDLFYVTPYRYLTVTNAFMRIRQNAIDTKMPNAEAMVDGDVDLLVNPPEGAEVYPVDKKQNKLGKLIGDLNPARKYSLLNLGLMFIMFCMIGWVWEVILYIIQTGEFVNRGTLYGPWLPIYGCGGILIILVMKHLIKHPALVFFGTMVMCGLMEYVTHWYLETTKGMKYWDYSNYFMNLNGRICLEGLLAFAILGIIFLYVGAPAIENMLNKINIKIRIVLLVVLGSCFIADAIYASKHPHTGKGVTGSFAMLDDGNAATSWWQNDQAELELQAATNPIIKVLNFKV